MNDNEWNGWEWMKMNKKEWKEQRWMKINEMNEIELLWIYSKNFKEWEVWTKLRLSNEALAAMQFLNSSNLFMAFLVS